MGQKKTPWGKQTLRPKKSRYQKQLFLIPFEVNSTFSNRQEID